MENDVYYNNNLINNKNLVLRLDFPYTKFT